MFHVKHLMEGIKYEEDTGGTVECGKRFDWR